MPPEVCTSSVCQAPTVVVVPSVVDGTVPAVVVVWLVEEVVATVVVDVGFGSEVEVAVDPRSVITGAATFSGAMGRSLTRSSAALTICHVIVVASTSTKSQAPARLQRFTLRLSQDPPHSSSSAHQGFVKTVAWDLNEG